MTLGKVRRIRPDGIIESPPMPQDIQWLTVGFDGRLVLNGSKLYKEGMDGSFYAFASIYGYLLEVAEDPTGAVYSPSNALVRLSPNCGLASVTAPPGPISQSSTGVGADGAGNVYYSADNSVWRIAPIAPPAADTPMTALDNVGVFNAASNLTALVTPPAFSHYGPYPVNDSITGNEILHITGVCMGPLEPAHASFVGGKLPVNLQRTQVLFDGEPAPLVSVQATEIFAIVPQDVAKKSSAKLTVSNQGATANASLNAVAAVPGVFISSGKQAAAINEDGSLNGPDHPAPVGSMLALFVTGDGVTDPPLPDGVAPDVPLPPLALPVKVTVGSASAEVVYAGAAFGLPGMAQVNIRVPAVAPSDAVPIQVIVGGNSRNQPVTIAVR